MCEGTTAHIEVQRQRKIYADTLEKVEKVKKLLEAGNEVEAAAVIDAALSEIE